MKIIYTINGQEASWCVSGRDKYELQRIMNDGVGIPADPMLDVLVFAAYIGEYSSLYGFYQEIVEEFLDPDELFDTEPIGYFNTVLQPMFEDDVKILDITDWDMTENKKENKLDKSKRLREDMFGDNLDLDAKLGDLVSRDEVLDAFADYAADDVHDRFGNTDFEDDIISDMTDWFEPAVDKALKSPVSEFKDWAEDAGWTSWDEEEVELPNVVAEYIWNLAAPEDWEDQINDKYDDEDYGDDEDEDLDESAKGDKMKALKEAVGDAAFNIADRFVVQARRVYNNIENVLSEVYPDGKLDPHQQGWFDSVYDAFYDLETGASRLRDGDITSGEFLEYIEQFMNLTEDEDDTNDYQTMWPIRKMFVNSCELVDDHS